MGEKKIMCMWLFLIVNACTANGGQQQKPTTRTAPANTAVAVSAKMRNALGDTLLSVIRNADRVDAFLLDPWLSDSTADKFRNNGIIERKKLSPEQRKTLKKMLTDSTSFHWVAYIKRCEIRHEVAYRLYYQGSSVDVLKAFTCDVWELYNKKADAKSVVFNADPVHNKATALARELFPTYFPVEGEAGVTRNETSATDEHVVKKGETLNSIAKSYKISMANLREWNGLSLDSNLVVGKKIFVIKPKRPER